MNPIQKTYSHFLDLWELGVPHVKLYLCSSVTCSKGDIVIDLLVDDCPITCKNFIKLCKQVVVSHCAWHHGKARKKGRRYLISFTARAGRSTTTTASSIMCKGTSSSRRVIPRPQGKVAHRSTGRQEPSPTTSCDTQWCA